MRNLLALAALALIAFIVVGYYLEWYSIVETTAADGQRSYSVVFFTKKIETDVNKGKQEVGEILQNKK